MQCRGHGNIVALSDIGLRTCFSIFTVTFHTSLVKLLELVNCFTATFLTCSLISFNC